MKANPETNKSPTLPEGFTVRPARLDEVKEIVDLLNLVAIEMTGETEFDVTDFKNDLQSPDFDIELNTRVVLNPQGKIVGYQDVFTESPVPVRPMVWGRVHPDYMGLGLGTYLFAWGKERAKYVFEKVPADARVTARTYQPSGWEPGKKLLEDLGLEIVRHAFEMEIVMSEAPPAPVWPEGISIHTYQHPAEAKALYLASEDAFQDHFGFVPKPEEEGYQKFKYFHFKDEGFDPSLWFLAKDGDEIAGFVMNRKWYNSDVKEAGFINELGVRRPWRKRGLGLALLHHSFNAYWQRGQKRVTLGVDAGSLTGAVRLYEKAGMHVHKRFDNYELELRPGRELGRTELEE
jgi:mycothiol synthase